MLKSITYPGRVRGVNDRLPNESSSDYLSQNTNRRVRAPADALWPWTRREEKKFKPPSPTLKRLHEEKDVRRPGAPHKKVSTTAPPGRVSEVKKGLQFPSSDED